ncbi:unnamed protein product [Sphagnum tenellum]
MDTAVMTASSEVPLKKTHDPPPDTEKMMLCEGLELNEMERSSPADIVMLKTETYELPNNADCRRVAQKKLHSDLSESKAQIFALVWEFSAFANYWKKRRPSKSKKIKNKAVSS